MTTNKKMNSIKRLKATDYLPYFCIMCGKGVKNIIEINITDNEISKDTWLCKTCFNKLFKD